jgi:hypothetical protein
MSEWIGMSCSPANLQVSKVETVGDYHLKYAHHGNILYERIVDRIADFIARMNILRN